MQFLIDITLIFAIAVAAVLVCHRLRIPSSVGFLLAGVLVGPDALGFVEGAEQVELLSEIGVVLLLFVIGLEFSISGLVEMRKQFFLGGTVQMLGTALIVGTGTFALGATVTQSVFLGFVVSLSSTAIVLQMLQERVELDSPHGRVVVGTLIFQDLAVVPLMLLAPLLAGSVDAEQAVGGGTLIALARIVAILVGGYIAYRWVVPWLLHQLARTGSREGFLLGVIVTVALIALATHEVGLSLALGAFVAGLIISESPYAHQAVAVMLPFRDVFMSLFFVSVGMLLDIQYLLAHPGELALLTAGILLIKPFVGAIAGFALGLPVRNAVLAGIALGQIGEFSLVATRVGVSVGLLDAVVFQTVLDTAVLSMLIAPGLFALGPRIADAAQRLPLGPRLRSGFGGARVSSAHEYAGHIIIVGFGVTGRNVARAAEKAGVPYAAIELNPETVRTEQEAGGHVHYGDATNREVLEHVDADKAKAFVIAINDPAGARRVTELARRVAPDAFIIVRSRYVREATSLHALGADEVVADEIEVSIEVFARVLARCLVPREEIERYVDETRCEWRERARRLAPEATTMMDLRVHLPDLATRTFRLSDASPLAGRTIAESGLRAEYGVTVLAVQRGAETIGNPVGATVLEAGDALFVIGPVGWDPAPLS